MKISEKDLVGLAFDGLLSHYKKKLEGFNFPLVNYFQFQATGFEYRFKNAKETCETDQSIHVDCKSDSNDEKKKLMSLYGH